MSENFNNNETPKETNNEEKVEYTNRRRNQRQRNNNYNRNNNRNNDRNNERDNNNDRRGRDFGRGRRSFKNNTYRNMGERRGNDIKEELENSWNDNHNNRGRGRGRYLDRGRGGGRHFNRDNTRDENRNQDRNQEGRRNHRDKRINRKKNTECFEPSDEPMDMRLMIGNGKNEKYEYEIGNRDVILVQDLFCKEYELDIYNNLVKEMNESGIEFDKLFKLWHGDTHYIADDKLNWKEKCPTFNMVIDRIREYFNMDVKATRFNWYKDLSEWKPYHHDAAAVKKDKMDTQNFTVGVSFGAKRIAGFEHAKHRTKISVPLPNGACYCFSKDVNIEWRHGIPQIDCEAINGEEGRISIIAWGWTNLAN